MKEEIGRGHEHAGLYYLEMTSPVCFTHSIHVFQLWHQRLGHLSVDKQRILNSSLSCGFDSSFHCNVCPLAKQTRLPFSISSSVTSSVFELLHCDIWGPYSIESRSGARYFLTIVDDYNRFTWTYLLRFKS